MNFQDGYKTYIVLSALLCGSAGFYIMLCFIDENLKKSFRDKRPIREKAN